MVAGVFSVVERWLRGAVRRSSRRRRPGGYRLCRRRPVVHAAAAVAAYRDAVMWGERLSRAAQEAVEVPAYEERALRGEVSPRRFRWRRRWYRVVEVGACWQDGRKPVAGCPEYGRIYFNVATDPPGLFQLYYDRFSSSRKGRGRWVLYRRTEIRPVRG